jgi:hypothetical protein
MPFLKTANGPTTNIDSQHKSNGLCVRSSQFVVREPHQRAVALISGDRCPGATVFVDCNASRLPVIRIAEAIHPTLHVAVEYHDNAAATYISVCMAPAVGCIEWFHNIFLSASSDVTPCIDMVARTVICDQVRQTGGNTQHAMCDSGRSPQDEIMRLPPPLAHGSRTDCILPY